MRTHLLLGLLLAPLCLPAAAAQGWQPQMDFAAAAEPFVKQPHAAGGSIGKDGKVTGGGLSAGAYVVAVLSRLRHGGGWLQRHDPSLAGKGAEPIAVAFALPAAGEMPAADVADEAAVGKRVADGRLAANGLYLFRLQGKASEHVGFVRAKQTGVLFASHFHGKGLQAGDLGAWLEGSAFAGSALQLWRVPDGAAATPRPKPTTGQAKLPAPVAGDAWRREQTRAVQNLGLAERHYEGLGFRATERRSDRIAMAACGTRLVLTAGTPTAGATDLGLEVVVPSLEGQAERLRSRQAKVEELTAWPSKATSLLVRDADGYRTVLRTKADSDAVVVPAAGEVNGMVLEVLGRYPTDGSHEYHWPKKGDADAGWRGCTKDIEYAGKVVFAGHPKGSCYCSGIQFEVFVDAYRLWCQRHARPWRIKDLDEKGFRQLQAAWFGSASNKGCCRTALAEFGIGMAIPWAEGTAPGDFVQLWRKDGSGHAVVFLEWLRDGGRIVGLKYWSTQNATDGIGVHSERFTDAGGRVLRDGSYVARLGLPTP